MATPAGPEPVGLRLEPGLPLGLQRVDRQGLQASVGDHRDSERAAAPVALGHIHPLDRPGYHGSARCCIQSASSAFCSEPHTTLPVHPGRLAASVELRHPPHRDQRVGCGSGASTSAGCGPSSGPQPATPRRSAAAAAVRPARRGRQSIGVPVERSRPRVRSPAASMAATSVAPAVGRGVQLALRFRRPRSSSPPQAHPTRVSTLSGPGNSPYPAGYAGTTGGGAGIIGPGFPPPFGRPAFASRVVLRPPRSSAFLTVGPPDRTFSRLDLDRGCHVPHETDTTGLDALCTPGTVVRSRPA